MKPKCHSFSEKMPHLTFNNRSGIFQTDFRAKGNLKKSGLPDRDSDFICISYVRHINLVTVTRVHRITENVF